MRSRGLPTILILAAVAMFAAALGGQPLRADDQSPHAAVATFGGGCFWCLEAVFEELAGVSRVVSGYAGGHTRQPSYREVCSGDTGHAEVVQISYDPEVVSYEELLTVFFSTHDPTTLDRQGADVGTQYRSLVLAHDEQQEAAARAMIARLTDEQVFPRPIVTRVERLTTFYPAEEYHQDYYRRNPSQGYCQVVIAPKMAKFRQEFRERLRR